MTDDLNDVETHIKATESIEVEPDVKEEDDMLDAPGEDDTEDISQNSGKVTNVQYKALKAVCDILTNYRVSRKGDEEYYPSILFRRIPNKRNLPDYHEIIKEPTAISTLKGKIQTKKYTSIAGYVRDFALIVHNAQVYNRPNSGPVRDVLELKAIFEQELQKLVQKGTINEEDTAFPDLGEIPYATPEPDPVSAEEEGDEDGEEDDEDEDVDDSEDEKARRARGRRGPRSSIAGKKRDRSKDDEGQKGAIDDSRKKRGRPPRVDTPMEARIKAVLKGIRKLKDKNGNFKTLNFEKLPDKAANPQYFVEIKEPIAIDLIKRKSKRKKYQSLEHFMKDMELMFRNAMRYNEDDSDIYKDAVELWQEAQKIAEAEKQKPDTEYMMDDGRLPLPNGILYRNELWKVGDWVHILNPNDVTKPIVAQIYRTWQDPEGQKWVNACWYYRPEQTVHQFEKHFYPNEVVKTGQYRDHQIEEIVDRCFVMFFTRYSRGRPRNLDPEKEVYVCEARYNEEKHKLNKIKTWASCLPDEVREKDYEMDLFDAPRKIKKVPSPLLHLLKEDAKDTDEVPSPEWRHPNAPPVRGAVHRQPRDENQSPPPEPTPPPPPTPPPAPIRTISQSMLPRPQSRSSIDPQNDANMSHAQHPPRPSPSVAAQISQPYQAASVSPAPPHRRQDSFPQSAMAVPYATPQQPPPPQTPQQQHNHAQPQHYVPQPPPSLSAARPTHYAGANLSQAYARPTVPHAAQYPSYSTASNPHAPRTAETYTLPSTANDAIPAEIKTQFPCDDQGKVLWFTTPPVDTNSLIYGKNNGGKSKGPLMHSSRYLAAKAEREKKMADLRAKREAEASNDSAFHMNGNGATNLFDGEERDADGRIKPNPERAAEIKAMLEKQEKDKGVELARQIELLKQRALLKLVDQLDEGTDLFYKKHYGEKWQEYKVFDEAQHRGRKQKWLEEEKRDEERNMRMYQRTETVPITGGGLWPGTGVFKDDYDARY